MAMFKKADVLRMVKETGMAALLPILEQSQAEQTGDFSFAFLVDIGDGEEHWVEIAATAKDTMVDDVTGERVPFDPFVKQAAWQATVAERQARKAEIERKHADKVKAAAERKRKAVEKAAAKHKAD